MYNLNFRTFQFAKSILSCVQNISIFKINHLRSYLKPHSLRQKLQKIYKERSTRYKQTNTIIILRYSAWQLNLQNIVLANHPQVILLGLTCGSCCTKYQKQIDITFHYLSISSFRPSPCINVTSNRLIGTCPFDRFLFSNQFCLNYKDCLLLIAHIYEPQIIQKCSY